MIEGGNPKNIYQHQRKWSTAENDLKRKLKTLKHISNEEEGLGNILPGKSDPIIVCLKDTRKRNAL